MMSRKHCLAAVCLFAFALHFGLAPSVPVAGQEQGSEGAALDPAEAYLKLSEPGPEHKMLSMRVGKWKVAGTMYMAPDAPPLKTEASSTVQAIMGGRYFREDYSGEFMGSKFTGLGIVGFDKGLKKYVSSWIDSMSTGLMRMEGTGNKAGNVITFVGEYFDPLRGQKATNKYVLTLKSKNSHVAVMFEIAKDGSERKLMELAYTRVP